MPKFRFELEAVIKQRLAIERQKQLVLADLERMRLVLEDKLRGFQSSITAEKNDLRDSLSPANPSAATVDLSRVRMQANMSLHLVAKAQQTVFQLAALHRRLEVARKDLLAATTRRKAVEKLKERRYELWRAEQASLEARVLDEIAVTGHAGRMEIMQ
ncbi:MAG: flagellar export protein FliJ [Phycisphaerales bacterium]|nr:flagellar export protein FliJ [Phycisphaerales bacterium]